MDKQTQSLLQCSNEQKNNKNSKIHCKMLIKLNKQQNNEQQESNNSNAFGVQGITILVPPILV